MRDARGPLKPALPPMPSGLISHTGQTRSGQPLSYNRAPAADLGPWVARLAAAVIEVPGGGPVACGMCNDTAVIRSLLAGTWSARSGDVRREYLATTVVIGPHSHMMNITVAGRIASANISLRPGALHAVLGFDSREIIDRIVPFDAIGVSSANYADLFDPDSPPATWLDAIEHAVRAFIRARDPPPPDPLTQAFEFASLAEPEVPIGEFAERMGVSQRRLERVVRRDFGLTPKQVLRRARALDYAARLLGVADEGEEDIVLRYFDQSHLIREFSHFFGMTPSEFLSRPRPLMTINLEVRQARRLELLQRLAPGELRPWQAV